MNATIVVAASSILLACVAFAFFMLQGGSDELTGSQSGSMTFSGEGHEYSLKYQVGDDEMSVSIFIEDGDGSHSALWKKQTKEGEFESEEIFLNDAASYHVVEFEDGVATSCRMNSGRDQKAINKMIDSIHYDGGSDTYSITEDDFDGTPLTISVTATAGDVTMPDFDWSTCFDIGDPVDPFRDGDSRKALEVMLETERALGYTTAGNLAQDVYNDDDSRLTCVPATSVYGDFKGQACYIKDNCNFAFRGSDDNADWADNILGAAGIVSKNGAWIHKGFYNQLNTLIQNTNINSQVNGCGNPTFIGHSLGGALANVAHTYWNKGSINTYAGASPYMGRRSVSCTENYRHCWWRKWWHYKCETRSRSTTCNRWHHVSGKRTYHESDPVPYAANIAGYNHGGGIGYRIEWVTDRAWWCCFDWCGYNGRWESRHRGETNEPTAGLWSTIWDIGENIFSLASGGTHYHSMSVHYQPYAV
eukprot:CAMPEP_0118644760 /NCGR_PEP_ID=MMETSP0785-20121206/7121_1 /TAXON_ID=91992 /ORGANISM="Bolidomonas pacifica, Strain CCMP 1866" /LENGTH=474 /DNA_ID=CAMNT_0006536561 /DNA_START=883 /DNA_END=2307 /DNA_ORIENTATION=+